MKRCVLSLWWNPTTGYFNLGWLDSHPFWWSKWKNKAFDMWFRRDALISANGKEWARWFRCYSIVLLSGIFIYFIFLFIRSLLILFSLTFFIDTHLSSRAGRRDVFHERLTDQLPFVTSYLLWQHFTLSWHQLRTQIYLKTFRKFFYSFDSITPF